MPKNEFILRFNINLIEQYPKKGMIYKKRRDWIKEILNDDYYKEFVHKSKCFLIEPTFKTPNELNYYKKNYWKYVIYYIDNDNYEVKIADIFTKYITISDNEKLKKQLKEYLGVELKKEITSRLY